MSDELVRVRDLKKIFSVPAGELHAVDGVDFSIARGSTIGIVGESGCGKSTMGRLLAMLLEATSGEILFDGQNIAKKMSKAEAMAYKKRIQMIFQDPFSSLNPRMTTFETIIEPLNIHRAGTLQEREARVYQLMETVGLSVSSTPTRMNSTAAAASVSALRVRWRSTRSLSSVTSRCLHWMFRFRRRF